MERNFFHRTFLCRVVGEWTFAFSSHFWEYRMEFVEFVIHFCTRRKYEKARMFGRNCILPWIVFWISTNRQEPSNDDFLMKIRQADRNFLLRLTARRKKPDYVDFSWRFSFMELGKRFHLRKKLFRRKTSSICDLVPLVLRYLQKKENFPSISLQGLKF